MDSLLTAITDPYKTAEHVTGFAAYMEQILPGKKNARIRRSTIFMMAAIHDTDFQGADLSRAFFTGCVSDQGLHSFPEGRTVGVLGSSFQEANLTGADFQRALIHGGDFTGASVTGARFERASLLGSCFSGGLLPEGLLSREQLSQVKLV